MRAYRYLHLDVFTDRPFAGNQLAVFVDGTGLADEQMQQIAGEMAFSESAFVFPPGAPDVDARLRIFTPRRELPMAGHPTIGTTFALAAEGLIATGRRDVTFGLGIGPTPVGLEWTADRLAFAWMTQPVPSFGASPAKTAELAAALSLAEREIRDSGLPVQVVSSGVPVLFVPLATREAVDRVTIERATLQRFFQSEGLPELPVFALSCESGNDDATVFSRMLAPVFGIPEDPATGGASGPLGAYLVRHRVTPPSSEMRVISLQGVAMGRPSRIHIAVTMADGRISNVRVGGTSIVVGSGVIGV